MLLHDHAALRLIFLNACEGARSGRRDSFAGIAQHLVRGGLPAVLAMQFPVSDDAAIALAQVFYQALADGYPADAALSEARKAIAALGNPLEWATPVLFSRSDDNRLIELPQGDRRAVIEKKSFEPETILIPAGPFLMGSADPAAPAVERPQHPLDLPEFRIGKYPVTNQEFADFIRQTRRLAAQELGWEGQKPPADKLDHPVIGVTWYDALAYCEWLSQQTKRHYTLPNEAQWEKAARGADGRLYPWGNEWAEGRCHQGQPGTAPKSAYPAQSPYGCHDMVGNARQWTRSLWGDKRKEIDPSCAYPWADDSRNDLKATSIVRRIYRGGAAADDIDDQRCATRHGAAPDSPGLPGKRFGLRVVMELDSQ